MKILIKRVGEPPMRKDIELRPTEMSKIVGGKLASIECYARPEYTVYMWIDEDAEANGRLMNFETNMWGGVFGDIFFAATDLEGRRYVDLMEDDLRDLSTLFTGASGN